jgi:SAM-dependent methyltransferase
MTINKATDLKSKLHLGCGTIILPNYVNVDHVALPGVDVVHDLTEFPWPFVDQQFDEVILVDILEHLPSVVKTLEEVYRITKPEGRVLIRVPYYNSTDASGDPTHIHFFNECTLDFFDPGREMGQSRAYYSSAKFHIRVVGYRVYFLRRVFLICNGDEAKNTLMPEPYKVKLMANAFLKKCLPYLAHPLGNIIRTLHFELVRLP